MTVSIDRMRSPEWANQMVSQVNRDLAAVTGPLPVFTVATLPSPTDKKWLWRLIAISDGAANKWIATTNGTAWRYMEGTAV